MTSVFEQRLAERRAKEETTVRVIHDSDLIPEPTLSERADTELDRLIADIPILDAYRRWIGKKIVERESKKRDGCHVSCPMPDHPDKSPSAWVNQDTNLWFCPGCNVGGDVYDLAAIHHGKSVPSYRNDPASFLDLRDKIATDLGHTVVHSNAGSYIMPPPVAPPAALAPGSPILPPSKSEPLEEPRLASVTVLPDTEREDEFDIRWAATAPSIDWKTLVPQNTFLHTWLEQCAVDDLPEEYYFWMGLQAIGFSLGRSVFLNDTVPVLGNMFVCLLGRSGVGKSRAMTNLVRLLRTALPYDSHATTSTGTLIAPAPGSAEALLDMFSMPVYDPTDPKKLAFYAPVRGLVRFDELSSLVGRASRAGSVLKPTLMEFYDGSSVIELRSRGAGYTRADNPFMSALTSTQPRALKELLSRKDTDSGFVNRWVFAVGPEKRPFAYMGAPIDIAPAVQPLQKILGWAGMKRGLTLEGAALKVWEDYFYTTLYPLKQSDDTDMMTRLDLLIKKVILLLAANEHSEPTVQHVQAAVALHPYLTGTNHRVALAIGSDEQTEVEESIIRAVREYARLKNDGATVRDIQRKFGGRKYSRDQVAQALKVLVAHGELDEVVCKPNGAGRPTKKWVFVQAGA